MTLTPKDPNYMQYTPEWLRQESLKEKEERIRLKKAREKHDKEMAAFLKAKQKRKKSGKKK